MALIGTLTSGVSALKTFTKDLEVIGNNIANVNTTAFKASKASFSEDLSNTLRESQGSRGTLSNMASMQVGLGVKLSGVNVRFTQGALTTTGLTTDLGVSGRGFFKVRDAGSGLDFATRVGAFRFDDSGFLVTAKGHRVQGHTRDLTSSLSDAGNTTGAGMAVGDIQLSSGADLAAANLSRQSVAIDRAGQIVEFYTDGRSAVKGQIALVDFGQPESLMHVGEGLYSRLENAAPAANGKPIAGDASGSLFFATSNGFGTLESGTLELSNVDLTEEFASMITAQRSFQAGSRVVTTSDQILEEIVNLKR